MASSSSTDPILVGRIGRAHGLAGEVVVTPHTDHPGRFGPGATVFVPDGTRLTVVSARSREGRLLVRFAEMTDRAAAEAMRGRPLMIEAADRRRLDPDEFWPDQLVGLEVRDPHGRTLGVVVAVVEGRGQHRLAVDTGEETVEVPFVAELVPEVRIEDGHVVVRPISGLFTPR